MERKRTECIYTKILAAFIRIFFLPSRVKRRHNSITFDSSDGGRVHVFICSSVYGVCICIQCACVWLMFASDHSDQCKCALYFRIEIESHVVYEQNNDSIPTPTPTILLLVLATATTTEKTETHIHWLVPFASPIRNSCHCRQEIETFRTYQKPFDTTLIFRFQT